MAQVFAETAPTRTGEPQGIELTRMKLKEIAAYINGRVTGDENFEVSGMATIEEAGPSDLTFLSNPKYARFLETTRAGAIIVGEGVDTSIPAIVAEDPYIGFASALTLLYPEPPPPPGIHPTAVVSPEASIGRNVSIGPYAVISARAVVEDDAVIGPHTVIYDGARVGKGAKLYSHCRIRENCIIGERVILQDGVTIGSDGFGYARRADQSWQKIPQVGIVRIGDDSEIGAGCTIDRAALGETRIGRGVKIDNLTHIGHGCEVGDDSMLCAQVGLAGSTRLGREVILLGQVGAAGHLTIGDRVIAIAQTGIPSSVEPGQVISGSPAIGKMNWLKSSAIYAQLPKLQQELRKLRRQVDELLSNQEKNSGRTKESK